MYWSCRWIVFQSKFKTSLANELTVLQKISRQRLENIFLSLKSRFVLYSFA